MDTFKKSSSPNQGQNFYILDYFGYSQILNMPEETERKDFLNNIFALISDYKEKIFKYSNIQIFINNNKF